MEWKDSEWKDLKWKDLEIHLSLTGINQKGKNFEWKNY
jgi:hypothetical protein